MLWRRGKVGVLLLLPIVIIIVIIVIIITIIIHHHHHHQHQHHHHHHHNPTYLTVKDTCTAIVRCQSFYFSLYNKIKLSREIPKKKRSVRWKRLIIRDLRLRDRWRNC